MTDSSCLLGSLSIKRDREVPPHIFRPIKLVVLFGSWYKLERSLNCELERWEYLASSSASVVPPDYVLIVFILFGQVVKEHTLCHRLKYKTNVVYKKKYIYISWEDGTHSEKNTKKKMKSIPFSQEKRQSDQSSLGAGWTWNDLKLIGSCWIRSQNNTKRTTEEIAPVLTQKKRI